MQIFIPPGGFAGFAQQTAAVQALVRKKTPVRRKRKATRKKVARKRPAARRKARTTRRVAKKKPARLVKGSAAARRHMAKLRRMRKR